ncbi:hypothetical protein EDB81DRAFT_849138 [Dactylonectria macrodidyma]|uniref:Nudix hydrolase domain-containing protein n=1 Tax=Dactylonectria macrodidyma TaxID=307937 RepID=A0A9P9I8R7_9HYPO|nr:hypothetical protein EDB81DRAFT_849138 [Dactylonectria macrodidyma]
MHEKPRTVDVLDSSDGKDTSAACDKALAKVVAACQEKDLFNLKGEEYEEFAIVGVQCPVRLFSPTISTFPNKLDSTVAGGISAQNTPFEMIIREAHEEASLPEVLTRRDVRSAGVLTYITLLEQRQGEVEGLVKPDMVHVYDMEVSEYVIPKPHDDEVKEFYLMTPDEIKTALLRKEFKTNSAAVMIDFFIRHGIITAENERDYPEMSMRLHRILPFASAPRL